MNGVVKNLQIMHKQKIQSAEFWRYLTADHERYDLLKQWFKTSSWRTDLINRLKELKNHEVAIINDLNDVEQQ